MLHRIHAIRNVITPWQCFGLIRCYASAASTPAPGRIYTQRQLFEVKRAEMRANNPEKYALASDYMSHRADRPKDYKPDAPRGRAVVPSPQEKRLLVLTGMYKRESDIPDYVSETRIAMMKERLNFMVSIFYGVSLFIAFLITLKAMYRTIPIARTGEKFVTNET